jgi:hypothetical protein
MFGFESIEINYMCCFAHGVSLFTRLIPAPFAIENLEVLLHCNVVE